MQLQLQHSRLSPRRGKGWAVAGREWKPGASWPLLSHLLEMEPAGLETPLPRQLLVLSHQVSWSNHLCLINGTQKPLSRYLLKNEGIAGEEGTEAVLEVGAPGKHLGPDEESRHSCAEGCILILCRVGSESLGSGTFCLQLAAGLFLDQGIGKRLGQVACLCSATSPTSSHCHHPDRPRVSGLMVRGGPSRLLYSVLLC